MSVLDRKLRRDLWQLRGMVAAISLVLLGGIATFVMARVTHESLAETRLVYYADQRFADVFTSLVRAPEAVAERISALPGVDRVETRVVAPVNIEIEGYGDPVTGRIVSLPERGEPLLNVPWLRLGRMPAPYADTEVTVSEDFAAAHRLEPGDRINAVIKGKRRQLTVVGVSLSPEYMYAIPPGAMFPDYERFGILWMNRRALATAYEMEGAFNDVSLTLRRGTPPRDVIDALDGLLARYGGLGAYDREDQLSHRFITEELRQLATMATVFPVIFLSVAALLLNVVVTRLVALEREQIGTLKAFGYETRDVLAHYVKLVLAMVSIGLVAGLGAGLWLARGMTAIYQDFYSFPYLHISLEPAVIFQAVAVTLLAALAGTLLAVRRAAALPPAVAMSPEPPPVYRATVLERAGLQRRLAEPTRMILRDIARRPLRAGLTVLGIAAAVGTLMITNFSRDAVGWMVGVQYVLSSREDLTVLFTDPTPRRALYSLTGLEGVEHAEGFRSVPARLVHRQHSYRTEVEGVEPGAVLQRALDADLHPVPIPAEGVILTEYLARDILGIEPGERLRIEVLEGRRPVFEVPVAGLTRQYLGVNAYMSRESLNRLMREGPAISGARLAVDPVRQDAIYRELRRMPRVAGTVVRENSIRQFNEMMEESILFFSFVTAMLGAFIAFGVVYNSARIALSERSRELASLRVLGFTRGEVGYILLGEIGLLTLAAIPLGFVLGRGLSAYLAASFTSDLYRIPLVVQPSTYALAASIVVGSFAVSAVLVWRRLARLDLIAVLKTRE